MDLFFENTKKFAPLADRVRPQTLEQFVGQQHIIKKGGILEKAIKKGTLGSCIFYGPPGTGKTTLANIIANTCNAEFRKLNAVSSGVSDVKAIIEEARNNLKLHGKRTYLLLDECHRWNKAQSDSMLQAIEDGSIILIGSTTENPFINMTKAIVSRSRVYEFKPLTKNDIKLAILNAIKNPNSFNNLKVDISSDALEFLAFSVGGDVRSALNALELAVNTSSVKNNKVIISKEIISECLQDKVLSISEDEYYDMLSAFCKSLRGSDAEAALFYAFRMIECGVDPLIIIRRLIAHSSEDVGMADSNALLLSTSALNAYKEMGKPEGLIPLTHAIIYVCEAEKSNSVVEAMHKAMDDAKNLKNVKVPNNLKNHPSTNDDNTGSYKYPHSYGGYVKQQYLPDELKDRVYYVPSKNGREKNIIRKKDNNK